MIMRVVVFVACYTDFDLNLITQGAPGKVSQKLVQTNTEVCQTFCPALSITQHDCFHQESEETWASLTGLHELPAGQTDAKVLSRSTTPAQNPGPHHQSLSSSSSHYRPSLSLFLHRLHHHPH